MLNGEVVLTHEGQARRLEPQQAWHGSGACSVSTFGRAAATLRYELIPSEPEAVPEWPGVRTRMVLEHPIALDPAQTYLMRCDRVEFAPGGEALPHGHKGGGIRYLMSGSLEVRIAGSPSRMMKPGDAWFESGADLVHAVASPTEPTSFLRVSILPRAIQGQSSIVYAEPAHAAVKPRQYTVFVDEPIELGP